MWYPATNRHAAFPAEFVDRFSGGEPVEHGRSTDTEGLLRQLCSERVGVKPDPGAAHEAVN